MPKAPSPLHFRQLELCPHNAKSTLGDKLSPVEKVHKVLIAQLCLTLCNPMDCSPPGSSVRGVAIPFSRGLSLTQGLNPGLLHCGQILYHPSHEDELRSMEKRCSNAFNSGGAADGRLRGTSPRHSGSSMVKPGHQAGQTHPLSEERRMFP